MKLSFEDEDSFKEGVGSLNFNKPPSDPNALVLPEVGNSSIPAQEMNEDIRFDNSSNHLDSLGGAGGSGSADTPLQERSDEIEIVARDT